MESYTGNQPYAIRDPTYENTEHIEENTHRKMHIGEFTQENTNRKIPIGKDIYKNIQENKHEKI